jgi:transcription elongation factor GreA-like protein
VPPQCQSDAAPCVGLYEDFNRDFIFVQFQSIDQSSFVNDKAYLIKMATGDISQVTVKNLSSSDEALMKPLLHLTVDAKQYVVSLENEIR